MITKKGIVTSAKMTGTITVTINRLVSHPLYKKSFRRSKKFLVDLNKMTDIQIGDEVLIEECKPLSKNKHFLLKEVIKRVPRLSEIADEKNVSEAMTRKQPTTDTPDSSSK